MKLCLISLLLASVGVSAHLGHERKRRRRASSLLPLKTNHSTVDWTRNDEPFRLGHHEFASLQEFKDKHARCGSRDPPDNVRIASQEQVAAYWQAHNNSTRRHHRQLQTIRIPVYFHCITYGSTGACSSSVVNQQIAVLNAAYAGAFAFDLVSSRSYNRPEYYNCDVEDTVQERLMKEEFHQGGMNTLNLYSCDPASGVLGWASLPDGTFGGGARDV
jgi:hypothetical protein